MEESEKENSYHVQDGTVKETGSGIRFSSIATGLKNRKAMMQFIRFFFVGLSNTLIDLGLLNLLLYLFDQEGSSRNFVFFKAVSFAAAVSCSYMLNKHFVFDEGREGVRRNNILAEGKRFFFVSVIGFVLNVSISSFSYILATEMLGGQLPVHALASVCALFGSAAAFLWNYLGYKFWVFKKK
jgi:putative flippase GtrA